LHSEKNLRAQMLYAPVILITQQDIGYKLPDDEMKLSKHVAV